MQGFEEKFDYIQIGEDHLVIITPCNHPLATHKTAKLTEAVTHPFIVREETSGTRLEVEKLLENKGIDFSKVKAALELGSTESVITAVSEGRGISIISSIAATKAQAAGLVKIVGIVEAVESRKLYMVKPKRALLKHSDAFWQFCKTYRFKNQAITCPS
jgi:DNA-binding transcriptional LysR family regulator